MLEAYFTSYILEVNLNSLLYKNAVLGRITDNKKGVSHAVENLGK